MQAGDMESIDASAIITRDQKKTRGIRNAIRTPEAKMWFPLSNNKTPTAAEKQS
jgi:hypothetical protein